MKDELIKLAKETEFESRHFLISIVEESVEGFDDVYYLWMCELQKWIREKHNILVFIAYCEDGFIVQSWEKEDLEECEYPEFDVYTTAETYKEALETGLYEALKLIK